MRRASATLHANMRTLHVFGLVTAVAALLGCGDDEATKGSPGVGGQGGAGGAGGSGAPSVQIGGQSGHTDSEHYQDSLPDYLENRSRQLPTDIKAAASSAAETVTLEAAP